MNAVISTSAQRERAKEYLSNIPLTGNRRYLFVLKLWRQQRSLRANRLYWKLVTVIAQETGGHDEAHKAQVHHALKDMFLPKKDVEVLGKTYHLPPSTRSLNTKEMSRYLDNIYLWADGEGILLPRPDDLGWDEFLQSEGE